MRIKLTVLTLLTTFFTHAICHAQEWAKTKLAQSTRHGEFVKVKHGDREVQAFVVYPEVKEKAPCVVVIHEIFGLSDWAKLVADEFAEAGYIAIAPDLLSGSGPNNGGTVELGDKARQKISELKPEQITADLKACADYVKVLPASNGKVACAGFCWGGGQALRFATNYKELKASMVFYGATKLEKADVEKVNCPVHGFYGENDNRINATIPGTKELFKDGKKTIETVEYKGAGHGFMRMGEDPANKVEDNKKGREEAWKRIKEIMKKANE